MTDGPGLVMDGTTIQRLGRLEAKVDTLSETVNDMSEKLGNLSQAEDRRYADRLLPERVRVVEDKTLKVEVYLGQLRWILAAVLGGVFGAIGLGILNLVSMR